MYQLTPLQLAVVNGHFTLAKRLIERGVGVDDGSLYLPIDTRNLGLLRAAAEPAREGRHVTSWTSSTHCSSAAPTRICRTRKVDRR